LIRILSLKLVGQLEQEVAESLPRQAFFAWRKSSQSILKFQYQSLVTFIQDRPSPVRKVEEVSKRTEEHSFSIELKFKEYVKQFAMSNDAKNRVLIEGLLGELEELTSIEGVMLEINGINGILRMDLREEDWRNLLKKGIRRSQSHYAREGRRNGDG